MTPAIASRIAGLAWLAWLAYWLVAASKARRTRERDTTWAVLVHPVLLWSAVILFFSRTARIGFLDRRFIAPISPTLWSGLALTFAGLAFSVWARIVLGGNWSFEIALKSGQELIRAGPYARIRHPIYTGILVAAAGAVFISGRVNALFAFALFALSFWIKARREEALLAREFGPLFEVYRGQTGMFLPRLRAISGVWLW